MRGIKERYEELVDAVRRDFRLCEGWYPCHSEERPLRLMRSQSRLHAFTATLTQEQFEDLQPRVEQSM